MIPDHQRRRQNNAFRRFVIALNAAIQQLAGLAANLFAATETVVNAG
jgi:hypothetical protein